MKKELRKRWSLESPEFFKKIQIYCLFYGTIIVIIGGSILKYDVTIGGIITSIGGTMASVGYAIAKLPIKDITKLKK